MPKTSPQTSPFLAALSGEVLSTPPVWFMRQAGRYLPEYRAVREEAGGFLDLCFDPEKAARVTLQPIERYDLDAAILFADILLVPLALGARVWFEKGEGPRIEPPFEAGHAADLLRTRDDQRLTPIFETVEKVRAALPSEKALIGFAGAPWTVATYMLAGRSVKDPAALRSFAYEHGEAFDALIDAIVEATVPYLCGQVAAGANAVQLFDSWAAGLPEEFFHRYCVEPVRKIAERVKEVCPVPVIAFPRGAGPLYEEVAKLEAVDAVSIDTGLPWAWAAEHLSPHATVQGGLDPLLVVEGGARMERAARGLMEAFEGKPYVFNLGHGFTPQTPPENVADLVKIIRSGA